MHSIPILFLHSDATGSSFASYHDQNCPSSATCGRSWKYLDCARELFLPHCGSLAVDHRRLETAKRFSPQQRGTYECWWEHTCTSACGEEYILGHSYVSSNIRVVFRIENGISEYQLKMVLSNTKWKWYRASKNFFLTNVVQVCLENCYLAWMHS